jgi:hypothetical protein
MITCPDCHTTFDVVYNRNPTYDRIQGCPFCLREFAEDELNALIYENAAVSQIAADLAKEEREFPVVSPYHYNEGEVWD